MRVCARARVCVCVSVRVFVWVCACVRKSAFCDFAPMLVRIKTARHERRVQSEHRGAPPGPLAGAGRCAPARAAGSPASTHAHSVCVCRSCVCGYVRACSFVLVRAPVCGMGLCARACERPRATRMCVSACACARSHELVHARMRVITAYSCVAMSPVRVCALARARVLP